MIKVILFDFSRVILLPIDTNYEGSLNKKYHELKTDSNYNFSDHFLINPELIQKIQQLKDLFKIYLFTTESIQEAPEIKQLVQDTFEKIFTVSKIGMPKDNPEAYLKITQILNLNPEEILFIDDSEKNIEAATKAGLATIRYINNEDLFNKLSASL